LPARGRAVLRRRAHGSAAIRQERTASRRAVDRAPTQFGASPVAWGARIDHAHETDAACARILAANSSFRGALRRASTATGGRSPATACSYAPGSANYDAKVRRAGQASIASLVAITRTSLLARRTRAATFGRATAILSAARSGRARVALRAAPTRE